VYVFYLPFIAIW